MNGKYVRFNPATYEVALNPFGRPSGSLFDSFDSIYDFKNFVKMVADASICFSFHQSVYDVKLAGRVSLHVEAGRWQGIVDDVAFGAAFTIRWSNRGLCPKNITSVECHTIKHILSECHAIIKQINHENASAV